MAVSLADSYVVRGQIGECAVEQLHRFMVACSCCWDWCGSYLAALCCRAAFVDQRVLIKEVVLSLLLSPGPQALVSIGGSTSVRGPTFADRPPKPQGGRRTPALSSAHLHVTFPTRHPATTAHASRMHWSTALYKAVDAFDGGARSFPLASEADFARKYAYEPPNEDYEKLFFRQTSLSRPQRD